MSYAELSRRPEELVVCLVIVDRLERDASAGDLGEDVVGGGGPYKWFGSLLCAAR